MRLCAYLLRISLFYLHTYFFPRKMSAVLSVFLLFGGSLRVVLVRFVLCVIRCFFWVFVCCFLIPVCFAGFSDVGENKGVSA